MISIGANGFQLFMNYIVAIILAIVLALALKLPLLPERPIRFSWTKSALFPTPVFAIGILAIFYSLNVFWIYNGLLIAIIVDPKGPRLSDARASSPGSFPGRASVRWSG